MSAGCFASRHSPEFDRHYVEFLPCVFTIIGTMPISLGCTYSPVLKERKFGLRVGGWRGDANPHFGEVGDLALSLERMGLVGACLSLMELA